MGKVLDGVDLNAPALLKNGQYQKAVGTIAKLVAEETLEQIVRDWQRSEGPLLQTSAHEVSFFGGSFKAQVDKDGQLSLQFMDSAGMLSSSGVGGLSLALHTLREYLSRAVALRILVVKYQAISRLAGLGTVFKLDRLPSRKDSSQAVEVADKVIPGGLVKLIDRTIRAVEQLLDADLVAIAQRYGLNHATINTYNFIVKNRAVFEKLNQEAPQLLPLLHRAVSDRVIRKIDLNAFQKLKQLLRDEGYSEAAWKSLIRMQPQLLENLVSTYDLRGCMHAANMVAEVGMTPPAELLQHWLNYSQHYPTPLWFRRAAAVYANSLGNQQDLERFLNHQYMPAVNWVRALQVRPDANQMKAGWSWIKRQADAWMEEVRRVNSGRDCSWPTLVEEYVTGKGKYRIVPLTSSSQLRDEGNRMSNCVGRYGYDRKCVAGSSRIFSVRAAASGKSLATVELCLQGESWFVNAIKASCNRPAKDCHQALMPELVKKYNDAYNLVYAEAPEEKK